MTHLLIDTPVLIKWFHAEGEGDLAAARMLRQAHLGGEIDAHVLDLAFYEVGDVLTRALHWDAGDVAAQLDDLLRIVGPPLSMTVESLRRAAVLAGTHGLSFYDASWAAAAEALGVGLVSADRQLVEAGLAETASDAVARLRLTRR